MSEWVFEPGFWVIASLVMITAIQAASAWLARPHFIRIAELSDSLRSDLRANDADIAWVEYFVEDALDRSTPISMAIFGPFAAIATVPVLVAEAAKGRNDAAAMVVSIEAAHLALVRDATDSDPQEGNLWNDPRRQELVDAAYSAQMLSTPLSSIAMIFTVVIFLVVFGVGWLLSVAPIRIVNSASQPVREMFVRLAISRHLS